MTDTFAAPAPVHSPSSLTKNGLLLPLCSMLARYPFFGHSFAPFHRTHPSCPPAPARMIIERMHSKIASHVHKSRSSAPIITPLPALCFLGPFFPFWTSMEIPHLSSPLFLSSHAVACGMIRSVGSRAGLGQRVFLPSFRVSFFIFPLLTAAPSCFFPWVLCCRVAVSVSIRPSVSIYLSLPTHSPSLYSRYPSRFL